MVPCIDLSSSSDFGVLSDNTVRTIKETTLYLNTAEVAPDIWPNIDTHPWQ